MGGCMSSSGSVIGHDKLNSALIISVDGDLRQYPLPVTSSQILHMEALSSTAFFICDSDNLFYDDFISAVDFEEQLEAGQIYFLLPTEKLQYRLSASDMAALAVKASVALNNTSHPNYSASSSSKSSIISTDHDQSDQDNNNSNQQMSRRKNVNKARISPFVLMEANQINVVDHRHSPSSSSSSNSSSSTRYGSEQVGKKRMSRSGSIRKLSRASSRRARLAVKSFRLRLSTIYEEGNHVLQVY